MKQFVAILLIVLMSAATVSRGAEKPFFPLGLWYEGGVGDARDNVLPADPAKAAASYKRDFADIAAHGINLIVIPNSPPEHHQLVLDTAQKHGLKVILELGLDGGPFGHMIRGDQPMTDEAIQQTLEKMLAPIKDHPALYRVQLLDEPPGDAFKRYGHIADAVTKFDPKTKPFCCLTGASDGGAFLADGKSDVVAFDMYPFGPGVKEGSAEHLNAFATYAQRFVDWANQAHADSWAVVQCHDITGQLRLPTAGELRCMTYASLATGNKGVFWFLYQSEHVGAPTLMGGLVDRDFKPRPLWAEVAKLSEEIAPLTETLAGLKGPTDLPQDDKQLLARLLTDAAGMQYVFVVNMDATKARTVRVQYKAPPQKPGKFKVVRLPDDKLQAEIEIPSKPENHQPASWGCDLPAGGGALFVLK
jgi:hypothetical protein